MSKYSPLVLVAALIVGMAADAAAQPLGVFRWQLVHTATS